MNKYYKEGQAFHPTNPYIVDIISHDPGCFILIPQFYNCLFFKESIGYISFSSHVTFFRLLKRDKFSKEEAINKYERFAEIKIFSHYANQVIDDYEFWEEHVHVSFEKFFDGCTEREKKALMYHIDILTSTKLKKHEFPS